ncbi:MAG TPA: TetR/AcrR family transcriptional regulator [Allosphingosinicella sp.]|nr:TetR/AcrR family transcriptional regulator [Allosphingosinicella sp.]
MEQKAPRRPGRPPAYDRDEVIEKAQRLFWREGSAGVSLDALSGATGLHKPSLYAAFGGKAGLYAAALDAYIERGAPDVQGAFAQASLPAALEAFFEADLDVFCSAEDRSGCFLVGTAIQAAAEAPEIRSRVATVFASLRRLIRARLDQAVADGELAAFAYLDGMTEILFGTHIALSIEARAGAPRDELRRHYRQVLDFLA